MTRFGKLLLPAAIAAITLAGCSPALLEGSESAGLAAPAALAAQTEAGTVDLSCSGTNTARFSPGLTFLTQNVHIKAEGEYTTCDSSDPAITSGTYTAKGNGRMSCLEGGHAGQFTITWNTGEDSTIEFTNSVALRPGGEVVVVATGMVIDGKFAGDRYDGTFTLLQEDGATACKSSRGVRRATGPTTLQFTST